MFEFALCERILKSFTDVSKERPHFHHTHNTGKHDLIFFIPQPVYHV